MKKYVIPEMTENSFDFCDDIAIPGDGTITTSMQLGKERREDPTDIDEAFADNNEWKDGLW
jgi:hypothetical protein